MPVTLGTGAYRYEVVDNWAKLPPGHEFNADVAAVGVDTQDRVYAFNRGKHPMVVLDRDGHFLRSWGEGLFPRAHGVHMAPDETLWLTDDGDHTVRHCTLDGKVLLTLGVPGVPKPYMSGEPFHRCTHTALSPQGELYVSDGYGNARVHMFSPSGQLKRSWGEPGDGPGQFRLPHGIAVAADGRVFVCDREIDRIQIFSPDGEFLEQWTDTQRPTHLTFDARGNVYVTELAWHVGDNSYSFGPVTSMRHARFSIFAPNGKLLARWGTADCTAPGSFAAPHGLALDSKNDLYVSEVTWTFAVSRGRAPEDCHTFQKFALVV